jgi:signal transduction protein with GAF and PtsI domain
MGNKESYFLKLIDLSSFLEQQTNLDECLNEILEQAAGLLNVENCSIMLFRDEPEGTSFRLRVFAKYGHLPAVAYTEAVKVNEGIAGQVAATGQPLLVEDIAASPYLPLARRPRDLHRSFISVPIMFHTKVIGVFNLSNPRDGRSLDLNDLNLASFVALLLGKSIQVTQLQNLLGSRYAQYTVAKGAKHTVREAITAVSHDPGKLAKLLAKSFYREMTRAGLTSTHIMAAASEILAQLHGSLARHRRRQKRSDETPAATQPADSHAA